MQIEDEDISNKSQMITLILCLLFGRLGLHRFYVGKYITGVFYLLLGGTSIVLDVFGWSYAFLVQVILLIFMSFDVYALYSDSFTDGKGRIIGESKTLNKVAKILSSEVLMNDKKKCLLIGLFICGILIFFAIMQYKEIKARDITFHIAGDIISFSTKGEDLIGLTQDGQLLKYDKNGKMMAIDQVNIKFISNFGELFLIKSDGSIIINLDDNYNGDIIGKIPGAKSGCVWSDMIVIVTDHGELFFYTDNSEVAFDFNNTEIVNGWTKVNDVSNVTKAYVYRNSGKETIFTLNAQGEVFGIGTYIEDSDFQKISGHLQVLDISSNGITLILLDEQGSVYQIGSDIIDNYGRLTELKRIEKLSNVKKLSTSYIQGAALTSQGEVYVWLKNIYERGKAYEERTTFGKVLDGDWDDIIISDYLYVIKNGIARRIDYKSLVN